jgi:thiol-disulfide isomerase/thioredoxin
VKTTTLLAAALAAALPGAAFAGGVKWEEFKAAEKAAKADGRLLHVHFEADWCGPCKAMERDTFGNAEVAEYLNAKFHNVKVDIDAEPELAKRFGVSSIPDSQVVGADGRTALRIVGNDPAFFSKMQALGKVTEAEKAAQANPKDPKQAIALADVYMSLARHLDAKNALEAALVADETDAAGLRCEALYKLGLAHHAWGRESADNREEGWKSAEVAWTLLAAHDPENKRGFVDDMQYARCAALADEESFPEALGGLKVFLERYPDSDRIADARFLKGTCEFWTEAMDEAVKTWKEVLEKHAGTEAARKAEKQLQYAEKRKKKGQ